MGKTGKSRTQPTTGNSDDLDDKSEQPENLKPFKPGQNGIGLGQSARRLQLLPFLRPPGTRSIPRNFLTFLGCDFLDSRLTA
jgi:hypothetical protein